ncbi:MAG: TrpR YerC/YecD [Clostridia bacterium]|nr:TrpR YerC/YecD [Clostridia bacterium]
MKEIRTESVDRLFKVISGLSSVEECYSFFQDVCTVNEILDMAQRFDTAVMLYEGENYIKVAKKVGISTATISRVNKCLQNGNGGYRVAIEKLKAEENA